MTQNQIITVAARKKMLRARAGEIQLPKIMGFVFGDGGVNASGEVISPLESESKLKHEILRKAYDKYTILDYFFKVRRLCYSFFLFLAFIFLRYFSAP